MAVLIITLNNQHVWLEVTVIIVNKTVNIKFTNLTLAITFSVKLTLAGVSLLNSLTGFRVFFVLLFRNNSRFNGTIDPTRSQKGDYQHNPHFQSPILVPSLSQFIRSVRTANS